MAKALMGHVGGTDLRLVSELSRLRTRVRDLESQVLRLQSENDALGELHRTQLHDEDLITLEMDGQSVLAGSGA